MVDSTVNVQLIPRCVLVAPNHVLICVVNALRHVLQEHIKIIMQVGMAGRTQVSG